MNPPAAGRRLKVLFLCTGNSARSILAEYLLRQKDPERFEVHSAGARPRGTVNGAVLELLEAEYGIDARDARSKSWEEFRDVPFDFVVTVCDHARESCPFWPAPAVVAHWGLEDPDAAGSSDGVRRLVRDAARRIEARIDRFASLPLETLGRAELEARLRQIGAEETR